MNSLIKKAKEVGPVHRGRRDYDKENAELAIAYLKGEVTLQGVIHALELNNSQKAYTFIITTLMQALRFGDIELQLNNVK